MNSDGTYTAAGYRQADISSRSITHDGVSSDSTVFAGEKSDGNSVHFDSISNPPTPTVSSSAIKSNSRTQLEHLTDAVERGRALFQSPISIYDRQRSHFDALRNSERIEHDMSDYYLNLSSHYNENTPQQQRPVLYRGEMSEPVRNLSPKSHTRIPVRISYHSQMNSAGPVPHGLAQNAALVVDALRSAQAPAVDSTTMSIAEKMRQLRLSSNSNLTDANNDVGPSRKLEKVTDAVTPTGVQPRQRSGIPLTASSNANTSSRAQSTSYMVSNSSMTVSSSFDLVSSTQNSENDMIGIEKTNDSLSQGGASSYAAWRSVSSFKARPDASLPPPSPITNSNARRSEPSRSTAGQANTSASSKRNESINANTSGLKYVSQSPRQRDSEKDIEADESSAFRLSDVLGSSRSEQDSAMQSYRIELEHVSSSRLDQQRENGDDENEEVAPPIRLTNEEVAALMDAESDEDEPGSDEQDHEHEHEAANRQEAEAPSVSQQSAAPQANTNAYVSLNGDKSSSSQTKNAAPFSFRGISLSTESLLRELEAEEQSVTRRIDSDMVQTDTAGNASKTDLLVSPNVAVQNTVASDVSKTQKDPQNSVSDANSNSNAAVSRPSTNVKSGGPVEEMSITEYFRQRSAPLGRLAHDATPTFGLSHSAVLTPARSVIDEQDSHMASSTRLEQSAKHTTYTVDTSKAVSSKSKVEEEERDAAADETLSSCGARSTTTSKFSMTDDNNNETLQNETINSNYTDEPDDDAVSLNTNRLVRRLLTESKLNELLAINARDANSTLIESDIIDYLARISSVQNAGRTSITNSTVVGAEISKSSRVVSDSNGAPTPTKPPIAPVNATNASVNRSSAANSTTDTLTTKKLNASPQPTSGKVDQHRTPTPVTFENAQRSAIALSGGQKAKKDQRSSVLSSTPSTARTSAVDRENIRQRSASSSSSSERTATSSSGNMLTTITPASSNGTIDTLKHSGTKPDSAFHEGPTTAISNSNCADVAATSRRASNAASAVSFAKRLMFGKTRVGSLATQNWLVRNETFDWLCVALERSGEADSLGSQQSFLLEPSFVLEPRSTKAQRIAFLPHSEGITSCEYVVSVRMLDEMQASEIARDKLVLTGSAESIHVQISVGQSEEKTNDASAVCVDFGALHWNAKTSREVTLMNLSGLPAPLLLRIVPEAGDSFVDDDTFTFGNESTTKQCVIDAFSRATVRIRCSAPGTRAELVTCRARLLVNLAEETIESEFTNSGNAWAGIAEVPISAAFGTAKLHIEGSLDSLCFDAQSREESQVRMFTLFNTGTIPATVSLCVLEDARSLFDVAPRVVRLPFDAKEQVRIVMRHAEQLSAVRQRPKSNWQSSEEGQSFYQARVLLSIEPDGPQYSVGLRVVDKLAPASASGSLKNEARSDKSSGHRGARLSDPTRRDSPKLIETGCLLSSRQVVEFSGVQLGAVTRERIVLKNAHSSRTLHLTLKLDCLPEANFALDIESRDSHIPSAHERTSLNGNQTANLILEAQQLKSVYVSFGPTRCVNVTGKLSIRALEFKQKYSIPLSAYGGVSWLTVTDGSGTGSAVSAEGDRPDGANTLTLSMSKESDRMENWRGSLSLRNSGWRSAFVRLIPIIKTDALTTNASILSTDVERETVVRIAPCSQFVLLANQSRAVQLEVQLIGDLSKRIRAARNESPSGRQSVLLLGKLLLLSCDEILRQRVRRSLKTAGTKATAQAKRNQVAALLNSQYPLDEFDVTCDGELLCNEQPLNEGENDVATFYERMRLIELNVYLNLSTGRSNVSVSLSQSQSQSISITNPRDQTPTPTPKSKAASSAASGTQTPNSNRNVSLTPVSTPTKPAMAVAAHVSSPSGPLTSANLQRSSTRVQSSLSGRSTSSFVSHSDSATVHVDGSENQNVTLSTSMSNLTGFTNYTDLTSVSELPTNDGSGEHRQLEHKLSLDRKLVDFGKVLLNEKKEAIFKFSNKSDEPVCMRIWLSDPVRFALSGTKIRVQPKHYVLPRVSFQSTTPGTFHALLMLTNVDRPQEYLTLRIQAESE